MVIHTSCIAGTKFVQVDPFSFIMAPSFRHLLMERKCSYVESEKRHDLLVTRLSLQKEHEALGSSPLKQDIHHEDGFLMQRDVHLTLSKVCTL